MFHSGLYIGFGLDTPKRLPGIPLAIPFESYERKVVPPWEKRAETLEGGQLMVGKLLGCE